MPAQGRRFLGHHPTETPCATRDQAMLAMLIGCGFRRREGSPSGELDQIPFLLGHVSIQTTERQLGCNRSSGSP